MVSALLAVTHHSAFAASPFQHEDWELVCDNTRTCYAAGYALDSDKIPAATLIKRAAGAGARVEITIRHQVEGSAQTGDTVDLRIGKVTMRKVPLVAALNATQVAQLLPLLTEGDAIQLTQGQIKSRISLSGAKAVLTKMDDLQGRVGTPSALVAKGKSNKAPLAPIAAPVIQAARVSADTKVDVALEKAVVAAVKQNDCTAMGSITTVSRLSRTHLLAEQSPCWTGARNSANAYWVVEQAPPHLAIQVDDGLLNEFDAKTSTLSGYHHSGRGCVFVSQWVWNGKAFAKASESSSGMCRVSFDGDWQLPTYRSRVLPAR